MKKILSIIVGTLLAIGLASFSYALVYYNTTVFDYNNKQMINIKQGDSIVFSLNKHVESIDFNKDSGFTIRTLEGGEWIDMSDQISDYTPLRGYIIRNLSSGNLQIDITFKNITSISETIFQKSLKAGWNLIGPAHKNDDQKMVDIIDALGTSNYSHIGDFTGDSFIKVETKSTYSGEVKIYTKQTYSGEVKIDYNTAIEHTFKDNKFQIKNKNELNGIKILEGIAYAVFISEDTIIPGTQDLSIIEDSKVTSCTSKKQEIGLCEITAIQNLKYNNTYLNPITLQNSDTHIYWDPVKDQNGYDIKITYEDNTTELISDITENQYNITEKLQAGNNNICVYKDISDSKFKCINIQGDDLLSISLNPSTPSDGIAQPSNQASPFLVFDLDAGSNDVTLNNVVLEFIGSGNYENLDDISIYNSNGELVSDTNSFSGVTNQITFNSGIIVEADSTMALTIKGVLNTTNTDDSTYGVKLIDIDASSSVSDEDLVGGLFTYNDPLAELLDNLHSVTLSIEDTLGVDDKYASIGFNIDQGNNQTGTIIIEKIELETAISGSGVTIRNDDNLTVVLNDTGSIILLDDATANDYVINNGDLFEFKVSNATGNSSLKIKPHGVSYSIGGKLFTTNNTEVIDLGTYSEDSIVSTSITINQTQINDRKLVIGNGVETVLYKGKISVGDTGSMNIGRLGLSPSSEHSLSNGQGIDDIISTAKINIGGTEFTGDIQSDNISFYPMSYTIDAGADNVEILITAVLKENSSITNNDTLSLELNNSGIFENQNLNHSNENNNLENQNIYKTKTILLDRGTFLAKVVQNGELSNQIQETVLAGSSSVALAEVELQAEYEDIKVDLLSFTTFGDFSDSLLNVRLVKEDGSVIASDAFVDYTGTHTEITFTDFILEKSDAEIDMLLISDLRAHNLSGGSTQGQVGDITIMLVNPLTSNLEGNISNNPITTISTVAGPVKTISVVPALVVVSTQGDTLGMDDKYAQIEFTIDTGSNDLGSEDIFIEQVEIATEITTPGLIIRNDDNTTVVSNDTTTTILLNDATQSDYVINDGDIYEFKVETDNASLIIIPHGITYIINGKSYNIGNTQALNLGTYNESN